MARNSSIDRLPSEIREKIGQLRQAGKTIDEILEKLKELDVDVSRSALGRHCKQLEEVSKSIRQSRIVAEALAKNFGDEGENKVSQVNIELMHSLILKMMVNNDGETITMDSKKASVYPLKMLTVISGQCRILLRILSSRPTVTQPNSALFSMNLQSVLSILLPLRIIRPKKREKAPLKLFKQ